MATVVGPNVSWNNGQYRKSVGFYTPRGSSKRIPRVWMLGKDEPEAKRKATLLVAHWQNLKATKRDTWTPDEVDFLEVLIEAGSLKVRQDYGVGLGPNLPLALTISHIIAAQPSIPQTGTLADILPPRYGPARDSDITLGQIKQKYLDFQRDRIGAEDGIKRATFIQLEYQINSVFNRIDPKTRHPIVDPHLPLVDLHRGELDRIRNFWMKLDARGLKKRTAVNYLKVLKSCLDWAFDSEISGSIPKPKGYDSVFNFTNSKPADVRTYAADELARLLAHATNRVRLYILLGLNCGMYQQDIASLRRDQVHAGYVYWERSKERANNFLTKHDLWPETERLLKRERAKAGELALVNEDRAPLITYNANDIKIDNISCAFKRLCTKLQVQARFKDLRKCGFNAIEDLSGDRTIAKQYASHAIDGVSCYYRRMHHGAFDHMNAFLKRWGDQLASAGVFDYETNRKKYSVQKLCKTGREAPGRRGTPSSPSSSSPTRSSTGSPTTGRWGFPSASSSAASTACST